MQGRRVGLRLVLVTLVAALGMTPAAQALTFTVDVVTDVGPDVLPSNGCEAVGTDECTFREAILKANDSAGTDVINFSIAANSTINVGAVPLLVTQQVNINAGFGPTIAINGPGAVSGTSGLEFTEAADSSILSGLAIVDFDRGITLNGADSVQITGNRIGLDLSSATGAPVPNGNSGSDGGIHILNDADNNSIGASGGFSNTIAANFGPGVSVASNSNNNTIIANTIGTDVAADANLGNGAAGIDVAASDNTILNNTIVDSSTSGIVTAATGTTIRGNVIGTASSEVLGNGNSGIAVFGAGSATIGGPAIGDGNTIVGSTVAGILLESSAASVVQGNTIGVDGSGNLASAGISFGNGNAGILIDDSPGNRIGVAGAGNVVSNNDLQGIVISGVASVGNRIEANTVGLRSSGSSSPAGNVAEGIRVQAGATANIIGSPGAGNFVAANGDSGIEVNGATSDDNIVQGNSVGVSSGGAPRGNEQDGISISGADSATVGGLGAGEGNLSSANLQTGIDVENNSDDTTVRGNVVGTNAGGTLGLPNDRGLRVEGLGVVVEGNSFAGNIDEGAVLDGGGAIRFEGNLVGKSFTGSVIPNGGPGVEISDDVAPDTIGGPGAAANTITGNLGPGILVSNDDSVATIAQNSIFANGGLGIDLEPVGVTANDANDADAGPNGLQNFPQISSALLANGQTTISGSIATTASTDLTLRFYASSTCDPSGNGEGQRFLGQTTVTSDGAGNVSFNAAVGSTTAGEQVAATATGQGTSEFSACRVAEAVPLPVVPPPVDPPPTTPPSNQFTIGKLKGTKLSLTVPGAGVIAVNDAKASKKELLLKPSSATASGAGTVTVTLKLTKTAKTKLKQDGKVKVKAAITFTPTGGTANTEDKSLKVK
jgi:hypothetical protein